MYERYPGGGVAETKKPAGVRLATATANRSCAARPTPAHSTRRNFGTTAGGLATLVNFVRDGNGRIVRDTVKGRADESKIDARGDRIERRVGAGEGSGRLFRSA